MNEQNDKIIDGTAVSKALLEQCKTRVAAIIEKTGVQPALATVLVGSDPASATYVRMKQKRTEAVGMKSIAVEMPEDTTTEELVAKITALSNDPQVSGILLQHPVPPQIDERAAFEAIAIEKDVDGVTSLGLGNMWLGLPGYGSCTPQGIMSLFEAYNIELEGKDAVVIGRSSILGKPMAAMLLNANATVTICHSRTQNLAEKVKQADIVVAAVGRPEFIKGEWIKKGAIVMDAGYNPGNVGDVEYDAAFEKASMITPVPGGVGPMTIATLISQSVDSAAKAAGLDV